MMADFRTLSQALNSPLKIRLGAIILGVIQGLLIYSQNRSEASVPETPLAEAFETFLIIAPISFALLAEQIRLRQTLVYALAVGAGLALVEFYIRTRVGAVDNGYGGNDLGFALVVSGFWIVFAGATYFPAWKDGGCFPPPYANIFAHAWNNLVILSVAGAFIIGGWIILLLWETLFNTIGIDEFELLFDEKWFAYAFSFSAFMFGITFAREMAKVIYAARALVLGLCAILAIALAAIGTGFVLVLPVTGLQPLWDTGSAASILIGVVLLIALGAVAVTREGGTDARPGRVVNAILMAGLMAASLLSVLAIYAVMLRIDQYGLTPERQYGFVFALGAAIFALPLGFGVLRYRYDWQKALVKAKPVIGLATMVLALGTHLPPFEPYALSAKSQINRLESGEVSASEFDFGYLRFKLGKPGRAALEELRADGDINDQDEVARMLAILDEQKDYYAWQATGYTGGVRGEPFDVAALERLGDYLRLFPKDAELSPEAIEYLLETQIKWLIGCRDKEGDEQCILIAHDMNNDGVSDLIAISGNVYYGLSLYLFDPDSGHWKASNLRGNELSYSDLVEALEAGNISAGLPEHYDLIIGGVRYR